MNPFAESASHPQYLPLSIARALWKRKFLVLSVWVLMGVATAVVVMMLPAVYRAETVILIEGQRIPERYVPTTVNEELRNRLSVLTQQIKSYENLRELIQEFDLYREDRGRLVQEEIIERMREDITVDLVRGFGDRERQIPAFTISFQGPNPQVVARVANAIRERFLKTNLKMREDRAVGTEEFLESQLKTAARDLERQEARLAEYRRKNSGQLPDQVDSLMATLNRLQLQLDGVQDSIRQSYQNKIMLENSLASAENSVLAFSGMASQSGGSTARNPKVTRSPLEREVDEATAALADLQSKYSEDHPDVRRAVGELERRKRALAAARASGGEGREEPAGASEEPRNQPLVMESLRQQQERVEHLKVQISLVEDDLRARNQDKEAILRRIAANQARLETLPLREQELAKVIRDYDISKANYQSLLNKRMEAEVASDMESRQQGERFTLLDPARVPPKPIKPQRELLIGGGVLAGLLLGMAIGFGFERKANVLLGEWELPAGTPVLGRVPPINAAAAAAVPEVPKAPKAPRRLWRKPRLTVRLRPRRRQLVLAPTILLCLLGVIIATSMLSGWSPF